MGDDMKLLEKTITNNVENIQYMENRVSYIERDLSDLKTNQRLTGQTVTHVMETLTTLKSDFKSMDNKMGDNIKEMQNEIKKSNERVFMNQIDQLKQYKSTVWKVGGSVVGSVIIGVTGVIISLGI